MPDTATNVSRRKMTEAELQMLLSVFELREMSDERLRDLLAAVDLPTLSDFSFLRIRSEVRYRFTLTTPHSVRCQSLKLDYKPIVQEHNRRTRGGL